MIDLPPPPSPNQDEYFPPIAFFRYEPERIIFVKKTFVRNYISFISLKNKIFYAKKGFWDT